MREESIYVLCNAVNIGGEQVAFIIFDSNSFVIGKLLYEIELHEKDLIIEIIQCLIVFFKIDEN